MLRKVLIKNYRVFKDFELELRPGVNVLIGEQRRRKSTLFEAINLALTFRMHGNPITAELSPYLFNWDTTQEYLKALRGRRGDALPEIAIELYLDDIPKHAGLIGSNNLSGEDAPGVRIKIVFDEDYREDYLKYVSDPAKVSLIPTEYYRVEWLDFGGNPIGTPSTCPTCPSLTPRLSGSRTARTITCSRSSARISILASALSWPVVPDSPRELRRLAPIADINEKLAGSPSEVSDRTLSLAIDISQRPRGSAAWSRTSTSYRSSLSAKASRAGSRSSWR